MNEHEDLKDSPQRMLALQESARRRISEYLHGHVQSKLLALQYYLSQCQELIPVDPEEASWLLGKIRNELRDMQEHDIRQASHDLYPSILKLGLLPALRSLRDRLDDMVHTELIVSEELSEMDGHHGDGLPEEFRIGIYRIVEEALSNVVKHAKATEAGIELHLRADGYLSLAIDDNGRGFDINRMASGLGITAMGDYAEALRGSCKVGHLGSVPRCTPYCQHPRASNGPGAGSLSFVG